MNKMVDGLLAGQSASTSWLDVSAQALEQDRPNIVKHRGDWFNTRHDPDPEKLVFIDQTGLSSRMARLCGRALCDEQCRAGVPHGHCKTTTFTSALRVTGMTAPFVCEGALNGNVFLACVEQIFVPGLPAGDIVVMDTCRPTRSPVSVMPSRRPEHTCFTCLPASPDFTPIENAFSRIKALLRAKAGRTLTALRDAVGYRINRFTPTGCANSFRATRYEPD